MNKDMELCIAKRITREISRQWTKYFEPNEVLAEAWIIVSTYTDSKATFQELKLATINKLKATRSKNKLGGMTFNVNGQAGAVDRETIQNVTDPDDFNPISPASPESEAPNELLSFLETSLEEVSPLDKQIILDYFIGGYGLQEIGDMYGMSKGGAKYRKNITLAILKEKADEAGLDISSFLYI